MSEQLRNHQEEAAIDSSWELTQKWIDRCLSSDNLRNQPNNPSGPLERRQVAQRIALYLAVCGHGISGVEETVLDDEDFRWIWGALTPCSDKNINRVEGCTNVDFIKRAEEMLSCCLQACSLPGCIAPFHQQILVHLAAEALETLAIGQKEINFSTQPNIPFESRQIWNDIGKALDLDGLKHFGEVINRYIGGPALDSDSEFNQMLRYWVTHRYGQRLLANINLERFHTAPPDKIDNDHDRHVRRIIGAAACILNEIRDHDQSTSAPIQTLILDDLVLHLVPRGNYLFWGKDEDDNALPYRTELKTSVLLAEQLISNAQYARFLISNPKTTQLPSQSEAVGWQYDSNNIAYFTESSMANEQGNCSYFV